MLRIPLLSLLVLMVASGLVVGACASDPPPKPPPPKCPKMKRGTDEVVEEVLCAQKDSDGDGVDDAVDLCEGAAETTNGEADGDGCPDPDKDQDLIIDFDDACPEEAGPPPDGCAVADADGDGLPDHLDGCPKKAEDIDGEDDADGCPEGDRRLQEGEALVVYKQVLIPHRRGKAAPTVEGTRLQADLLDGAAERVGVVVRVVVEAAAGLKEVRRGRAQKLADRRAEDLRRLMARVGIPPSRIETRAEVLTGDRAGEIGGVRVTVEIATRREGDAGVVDDTGAVDAGASPF
jgi:hypothetical protein